MEKPGSFILGCGATPGGHRKAAEAPHTVSTIKAGSWVEDAQPAGGLPGSPSSDPNSQNYLHGHFSLQERLGRGVLRGLSPLCFIVWGCCHGEEKAFTKEGGGNR